MTKTNQMRTLYACIILMLITGSIFIALAFGAGRRAKPSETESEQISESVTEKEEQTTKKEDVKEELPTETTTGTKKPVVESEPEENVPVSVGIEDISFIPPAEGNVIVACSLTVPVYSMTMNDYRTHMGVDVGADVGSSVFACADGTVSSVYEDPMMGMTVEVTHGEGIVSVYRNLSPELPGGIAVGVELASGDVLGYVGETALIECEEEAHLHFELKLDGEQVDPTEYITMTLESEVFED